MRKEIILKKPSIQYSMMKNLFITFGLLFLLSQGRAQYAADFMPARNVKLVSIFDRVKDSLRLQFQEKGLPWPMQYMYIRAFKHEKLLEVWVKDQWHEKFRHFKTYKVCATSGTFGPKRKEGDKQIPEGFYYINEFRPNSTYHLALGLNYPNLSDELLSDQRKPGGDIYIHGDCVTIGCLPLTDSLIEEVYYLASLAKERGQHFIPVHVFPMRYDSRKAMEQFNLRTRNNPQAKEFSLQLRDAYEYFEDTRQLPVIMVNGKGNYVIAYDPNVPKVQRLPLDEEDEKPVDPYAAYQPVQTVDKIPVFAQGNAALQRWLFNLSTELGKKLPEGYTVALQLEFLVDKEGNTRLPRIIKGGEDWMNRVVLEKFEKELKWIPAQKDGQAVSTVMRQSLNISGPEDL